MMELVDYLFTQWPLSTITAIILLIFTAVCLYAEWRNK